MAQTSDIDANGYWTSDNFEALLGLACYEYLAKVIGDTDPGTVGGRPVHQPAESGELDTVVHHRRQLHLNYIPCSMVQPNTANRCSNPEDANWAAPGVYFNWAWNALPARRPGDRPGWRNRGGLARQDPVLRVRPGERGWLPANTFGGYPGEGFWSTAYNGAYGAWGLASNNYRDEGILSLELLISQRPGRAVLLVGGLRPPGDTTPWIGNHPASCGGSSPHSWGIAMGDLGLLDSLVSQATNGSLIVGRGVPNSWVGSGQQIAVSNFPTTDGHRIGATITTHGDSVTLQADRQALRTRELRAARLRQQHRVGISGHDRQRSRRGHHIREHPLGDGRDGARTGVVTRYQVVSAQ